MNFQRYLVPIGTVGFTAWAWQSWGWMGIAMVVTGGVMWLLQRSIGKPFAKWETLSDDNFRKIYDVLLAIEDGRIEVEDHYVKGYVESLPDPEPQDGNINPGEQESLLEDDNVEVKKNAKKAPGRASSPGAH